MPLRKQIVSVQRAVVTISNEENRSSLKKWLSLTPRHIMHVVPESKEKLKEEKGWSISEQHRSQFERVLQGPN